MDDGRRDEDGRLVDILDELARRTGRPAGHGPYGTHDHWPLYEAALGDAANHGLLFEAVWFEPDQDAALGVVLRLIGGLPAAEGTRWIAQLRWEFSREYANRCARGERF